MRKQKKGFTVVELVVVIAIIAVLAAVLIPTFTSIIKKANDSAYLQERTNQQLQDLIEKVENQNYLTWEDFEAKLAAAMADSANDTSEKIAAAVKEQLEGISGAGLSEDQVKKIVEKALEGQLTSAQVEAIVNQAIKNASLTPGTSGGLTEAQVRQIVNSAIAGIKQTGVTKEEMKAAITSALQGKGLTEAQVTAIVGSALDEALSGFSPLTEDDIKKIVDAYIESTTPAPKVVVVNSLSDFIAETESALFTRYDGSSYSVLYTVKQDIIFDLRNTIEIHGMVAISGGCNCEIKLNGHEFKVVDYSLDADEAVSSVGTIIAINIAEDATLTMTDTVGTGGFKMSSYMIATPNWFAIFYNNGTLNLNGGTYWNKAADMGNFESPVAFNTSIGTINIGGGTTITKSNINGTGTVNDNRD